MRSVSRASGLGVLAAALVTCSEGAALAAGYDWTQFNGDPQHSGSNARESAIGAANVGSLTQLFQVTLPSVADGAPAVLASVNFGGTPRDALFVTTKDGHLLALDAHTGALLWVTQHGPGSCTINQIGGPCYTTSSPAIDPARAFVYAYGLDGAVHRHDVATGTETLTGGWPQTTTLKAFNEKGSSALAIATAASGTSYLYVTNGGYPGDGGDYQGHVTAIDLSTGAQNVFNALCSDQTVHFMETPGTPDCAAVQSAIWARSAVVYSPALDEIFMATGNGNFNPSAHQWGDTVFALSPSGVGAAGVPLDTYTPTNFQLLQNADADLGSTAPAILPTPSNSNVRQLAVQSGKDGMLRLLNLQNLSSQGAPGNVGGSIGPVIDVPQGGDVFSAIAVWVNRATGVTWAFVSNASGTSALTLAVDAGGNPSLVTAWQNAVAGTSPLVANGVLYVAGSGALHAFNPTTGAQLWQGTIGGIHWESPVVANGIVYVTDESAHLTAFAPTVALAGVPTPALPPAASWVAAGALALAGWLAGSRRARRVATS